MTLKWSINIICGCHDDDDNDNDDDDHDTIAQRNKIHFKLLSYGN